MSDKSRWQAEYESLPQWGRDLIDGLAGCGGYGFGNDDLLPSTDMREEYGVAHVFFKADLHQKWFGGISGAIDLARALTAPWPPSSAPVREKRAFNIVELAAGDDDCAFDQPCAFGHRVQGHAVYCHHESWPDSPRKCRRNRDDFRHEDCPGFVLNPDWTEGRES